MISKLGFLSAEAEDSERQLLESYRELFSVSARLSQLFVRLLSEADLDQTSVKSMVMNALAAKSLELFQSCVILLKKGCIPASRVVCRALIETVYKLCAVLLSSDGIDAYVCQEKACRLNKLKNIQKYKQKYPNAKIAPGIESEIETLSKEKPAKIEPHKWASMAQMEDFNHLYYQGMSDDTHANIESLNHYFDEQSEYALTFGPSDKGLGLIAAACYRTAINAIAKYSVFLSIDVQAELASISKETDLLEEKYGDC